MACTYIGIHAKEQSSSSPLSKGCFWQTLIFQLICSSKARGGGSHLKFFKVQEEEHSLRFTLWFLWHFMAFCRHIWSCFHPWTRSRSQQRETRCGWRPAQTDVSACGLLIGWMTSVVCWTGWHFLLPPAPRYAVFYLWDGRGIGLGHMLQAAFWEDCNLWASEDLFTCFTWRHKVYN